MQHTTQQQQQRPSSKGHSGPRLRWQSVLGAEGLHFASVIDEKINAFNSNQADAVTISAPERAFIKLWRHQTPEFLQLLEYHWQNFKVAESAVFLKIWAMPDLSPDTKVARADRSKPLWQSIMTWSPEKNYYWMLRCIGTFVKNIKEQQVSGKKISLRASANKYRVNFKDASLRDQACVFAHFLPEWKAHLSNQQLQDILARFSKGYLQKELEEKVKTQDAELKATDFRFAQHPPWAPEESMADFVLPSPFLLLLSDSRCPRCPCFPSSHQTPP